MKEEHKRREKFFVLDDWGLAPFGDRNYFLFSIISVY
jgi:hypothetical protein